MKYLKMIPVLLVLAAVGATVAGEMNKEEMNGILNRATELYRAKEYDKAVEQYEKVLDFIRDNDGQLYNAACTYSLAGNRERAVEVLEMAVEAGWNSYDHMNRDTDLDNIREEPGFKRLMADLEEKAEAKERGYKFWYNPDKTEQLGAREFELVGVPADTVPESARRVRDLYPFGGGLFLGYGDGMDNKGPVALVSFRPVEKEWRYHFMVQEHVVARFRGIGDELYIPGAEPYEGIPGRNYIHNYDFGNIFRIFRHGGFVKYRTVPMALHIQDIAKLGSDFFCTAGTANEGWQKAWGAIFRSRDGCVSWTPAYDLEGPENAVTRLGVIRPFKDKLYAFGYAFTVNPDEEFVFTPDAFGEEEAIVYDGREWTTSNLVRDEGLLTVRGAEEFKGRLVINAGFYDPAADSSPPAVFSKLYAYDGKGKTDKVLDRQFTNIGDLFVAGDWLYLLVKQGDGRQVLRTRDLAEFETALELPEEIAAACIAVLDGYVYFGCKGGEVYRTKL